MAEVPVVLDACVVENFGDRLHRAFRHAEDRNRWLQCLAELFQMLDVADDNIAYLLPDQRFVAVENTDQLEAARFERHMCCNSASQIARADQDRFITAAQAEDVFDFVVELLYAVPVALLPEAAEAVEILPDLRSGQLHPVCELL